MRYKDPLSITCQFCGEQHEYSMNDILQYKAMCINCKNQLKKVSDKIWINIYENAIYNFIIELSIIIKEIYNVDISTEDIHNQITVKQLIYFIIKQRGLNESENQYHEIKQIIFQKIYNKINKENIDEIGDNDAIKDLLVIKYNNIIYKKQRF